VEAKRVWFPRFTIAAGVLLLAFTYWMAPVPQVFVFTTPAVALVTWLNLKLTKVCPGCGAMLQSTNWFVKMRFCQKCGAQLDPSTKP
jgi:NADH pyrophosphatase NudC (nudix superfamily)